MTVMSLQTQACYEVLYVHTYQVYDFTYHLL